MSQHLVPLYLMICSVDWQGWVFKGNHNDAEHCNLPSTQPNMYTASQRHSNNSHPCQTAAIPITNHKRSLDTNLAGSDPTYHFNKKKCVRRLFFAAKPENSKPSEYSIDVGNKDIKCTINAFVICDCKLPLNSNKMFQKQCVGMK